MRAAIGDAGAGAIGNYDHCSFESSGQGRFRPLEGAEPTIGTVGDVAVVDEQSRESSRRVAAALRERGIACEVAPSAAKFGKQIRYAERRGIPFVWFPGQDGAPDQVKDIRSGDQVDADPDAWTPPVADLRPQIKEPLT